MKRSIFRLTVALACLVAINGRSQTNISGQAVYTAARSAFFAHDYPVALSNLTRLIETYPPDAGIYNERGMTKWWLKDYQGAIADYDEAIKLDPKCGGYYCNRGQAKFSQQKISAALMDYNQAIQLDPANAQAYFNRGTLKFLNQTNATEALMDFNRAIDLHSDANEEDIFYWRGNAKAELKDFSGAQADYQKSLALNPNGKCSSLARTNLAVVSVELNKFKQ
jgi:tetratricopeptide (TPR) repeat protein